MINNNNSKDMSFYVVSIELNSIRFNTIRILFKSIFKIYYVSFLVSTNDITQHKITVNNKFNFIFYSTSVFMIYLVVVVVIYKVIKLE
jgi:hypothetical protein